MYRKQLLVTALIVLLFVFAGAQAQSTDDVFCGDLSQADCQILLTNAAAMDEVFSLGFNARMDFQVTGDGLDEPFLMRGSADGRLAFDPAAAAAIKAAESGAALDGMASLLESLFGSMAGEISLSFISESAEEDLEMELNIVMKEGVIVLDASSLEALTDESMGDMAWFGFDITGVFDDLLEEAGMEDMSFLAAMEEAGTAATTITRLPDEVVAGIPVAVFQSSVDLNAILSSMTIEDLQAEARPDQMQDVEMAFALTQNIDVKNFSNRQYIGMDDRYTHRMDLAMDIVMRGAALGLDEGGLNMTIRFEIYLSDFNEPFDVVIPEDAFILPLAMLTQMSDQ